MGMETQTAYYTVQLYCPQCGSAMSQQTPKHQRPSWITECLNARCINHGKRFQFGPMMVPIHDLDC